MLARIVMLYVLVSCKHLWDNLGYCRVKGYGGCNGRYMLSNEPCMVKRKNFSKYVTKKFFANEVALKSVNSSSYPIFKIFGMRRVQDLLKHLQSFRLQWAWYCDWWWKSFWVGCFDVLVEFCENEIITQGNLCLII